MTRFLGALVKRLPLLVVAVLPLAAFAADVPVTYLVDAKALKSATATAPLTFTLYRDAACTSAVTTQVITAGNLDVLEQLKRVVAKSAPKPPATVRVTTKLTGVTTSGDLFLHVTGTGITAVGSACQPQGAQVSPHVGVAVSGTIRPYSPYYLSGIFPGTCSWIWESGLPGASFAVRAADRLAQATLAPLDCSRRYPCTADVTPDFGVAYDLACGAALPASCTDGLKNQDETAIDCGGGCTGCANFGFCLVDSDCASGVCGSTNCPSPTCTGGVYPDAARLVCQPASCRNGVKDGTETDVDCGNGTAVSTGGCPACNPGKICTGSGQLTCSSGVCSAGICQP